MYQNSINPNALKWCNIYASVSNKLKKKIGEGSFGKIYIGVHTDTKEEYAIKLVSKIFTNIIKKSN